MNHISHTQMEKLKGAKTIKELKEALVEIFEELDVEMENVAYTAVKEALKNKENARRKRGERDKREGVKNNLTDKMNLMQLQQQFNPAFRLCQREGIKTMPEDRYIEITSILQKGEATHHERIWVTGFLKWIGFSAAEVMQIIDKHNQWLNFDSQMTWYQICSIFKIKAHLPRGTRRRSARKAELPPLSKTQQKRIQRATDMMDREKWHDGLVIESVTTLEPVEDDDMEPTFENGCLFGYIRKG